MTCFSLFAHDILHHRYIIQQAFLLIKISIPNNLVGMEQYLGITEKDIRIKSFDAFKVGETDTNTKIKNSSGWISFGFGNCYFRLSFTTSFS